MPAPDSVVLPMGLGVGADHPEYASMRGTVSARRSGDRHLVPHEIRIGRISQADMASVVGSVASRSPQIRFGALNTWWMSGSK